MGVSFLPEKVEMALGEGKMSWLAKWVTATPVPQVVGVLVAVVGCYVVFRKGGIVTRKLQQQIAKLRARGQVVGQQPEVQEATVPKKRAKPYVRTDPHFTRAEKARQEAAEAAAAEAEGGGGAQ